MLQRKADISMIEQILIILQGSLVFQPLIFSIVIRYFMAFEFNISLRI